MTTLTVQENVISFFSQVCRATPDKPALIFAEDASDGALSYREVTFKDLEGRVDGFMNVMKERGIKSGDHALIMQPPSLELYIALLACFKRGVVVGFVDPFAGLRGFARACTLLRPKIVVGPAIVHGLGIFFQALRQAPVKISTTNSWPGVLAFPKNPATASLDDLAPVTPDTPALVTFTTGSTGVPKGANRTHGFLTAQQTAITRHFGFTPADVDLPVFPIFLLNNLATGITSVIPRANFMKLAKTKPADVIQQIQAYHVTTTTASPAYLELLADYAQTHGLTLPSLKKIFTGGAPVPPELLRKLAVVFPEAHVQVVYGSTEVEPMAHIDADEILRETGQKTREGAGQCVGKIVSGLEAKAIRISPEPIDGPLISWEGLEVPQGQPGELVVTGAHVCKNYFQNPGAFRQTKFVGPDGDVWHRTNDLGYFDAQGRFWMVGRINSVVSTPSGPLFSLPVEEVVNALPFVTRAALIGLKDSEGFSHAVLVVQPQKDRMSRLGAESEVWEETIRARCREKGWSIRKVVFQRALPVDPRHNSKIDYPLLTKRLGKRVKIISEAQTQREKARPFLLRFHRYLLERFPVTPNLLLIASYFSANNFLVQSTLWPGQRLHYSVRSLAIYGTLFLMFFHLRILDEFKDRESDCQSFPDRLLSRSVVTYRNLLGVGGAVFLAEGILSATLGPAALLEFAVVLGFSLLMFKEFFVREWLRARLVPYAASHMFILVLFALFIFSSVSRLPFYKAPSTVALYAWVGFFATFCFEIARKIRAPEQERAGVDSYSKILGPRGASMAVLLMMTAATAICWVLGRQFGFGLPFFAGLSILLGVNILIFGFFMITLYPGTAGRLQIYASLYIIAFDLLMSIEFIRHKGVVFLR